MNKKGVIFMLCQNCGENDANVRYTQIMNGVKKEMFLCNNCSKKLGIGNFDFNMPINLSSFLGEFLDEEVSLLPSFASPKKVVCEDCGMSYEEFIHTGKFGCEDCFEVFSDRIDSILRNIQGGNRHIGRSGRGKISSTKEKIEKKEMPETKLAENSEIEVLNKKMKKAIEEENYENAAKIRDEIKKIKNRRS